MELFEIYPAIDLRHGQVVRLQEGDPERQTVFEASPLAAAQRWYGMGAKWLHVVNLDGAFGESSQTDWKTLLPQLCNLGPRVQLGGGMRSLTDIESALKLGVSRVVLGTVAVEQPELVRQAVLKYGSQAIAVGLDTRDGRVQVRGWKSDGGMMAQELGKKMKGLGVETVIHTDIARDGLLTGANAQASADLAQACGLEVIVSGGVAGLADIQRAHELADKGVAGIIAGRALYQGTLDLRQALAAVRQSEG